MIVSKFDHTIKIPFFSSLCQAGFPSPADDFTEIELSLDKYVIRHPEATYYIQVAGESMSDVWIHEGDILIVDKAVKPDFGDIIIASLDGDFTVKTLIKENGKIYLKPENPKFSKIEITEFMNFKIWGVVIYTLHKRK